MILYTSNMTNNKIIDCHRRGNICFADWILLIEKVSKIESFLYLIFSSSQGVNANQAVNRVNL